MPLSADSTVCSDQQATFFRVLTHDDRNSNYIIAQQNNGVWREHAYRSEALLDRHLDGLPDCFVTHNGFAGARRVRQQCRQLNAIMYDLDCHCEQFRDIVPLLTARIKRLATDGVIPEPNLLVDTGRGVQLYYVMKRSIPSLAGCGLPNEKIWKYFCDVEAGLGLAIKDAVADIPGVEFDASVLEPARVGRIPGTYNVKAGRACELVSSSQTYYDLSDLKRYVKKQSERGRAQTASKKPGYPSDWMLRERLRETEELQRIRGFDCVGHRELMCFVFYNTAKQLFGSDAAYQKAKAYNACFQQPLPQPEIDHIQRSVDNAVILYGPLRGEIGFYPLSATSFADKLGLTAEEMEAVGFCATKKERDRAESKRRTAEKRELRDSRIRRLYAGGLTIRRIADALHCSIGTVSGVLKGSGIERGSALEALRSGFERVLTAKQQQCSKNRPPSQVVCLQGATVSRTRSGQTKIANSYTIVGSASTRWGPLQCGQVIRMRSPMPKSIRRLGEQGGDA